MLLLSWEEIVKNHACGLVEKVVLTVEALIFAEDVYWGFCPVPAVQVS
jgi:hypothetical protein